jgi:hypothetical protein
MQPHAVPPAYERARSRPTSRLSEPELLDVIRSTEPFADLLAQRSATADRMAWEIAHDADNVAAFTRNELDDIDARIARQYPGVDAGFRALFVGAEGRHAAEYPFDTRAVGATARGLVGGLGFSATFWASAVAAAPLLGLARIIATSSGESWHHGFVSTNVDANGIVTDGSSISVTDPAFSRATFAAYSYKNLLKASDEMVRDPAFDIEGYTAEVVAPIVVRDFADDCITGDGSSKPRGLASSGALTAVTAGGASVVTFDDIAALLAGVPAAHRYSGRCHLLLSPGAHTDLLEEQPLHAWHTNSIHGVPFTIDTGIANPATTAISAIAGDFRSGYGIRLAPLRIDTDRRSGLANDQVMTRVVLRADGQPLLAAALRALVHP